MKENKLLTISIAAYNAEQTLGDTLASLEAASDYMDRMDIIIVNDGSLDRTAETAEAFRVAYPDSVRVISKENGGYGSAVNASLAAAGGRYFRLLDADDTFDAAGLTGFMRYLQSLDEENSPDLILSPYITERLTVSGDKKPELRDHHRELDTSPVSLESAEITHGISMFEICVRTEVLRDSGVLLTEHCYYTDNEFAMAALLYSADVARYPEPVYRYRLGVPGQSMSVEGRQKHLKDKFTAALGTFAIYNDYQRRMTDDKAAAGSDECPDTVCSGTRRLITDKLISMMVREVYAACMLTADPAACRKELAGFDRTLMTSMPYIYNVSCSSRLVAAARRSGSTGFRALSRAVRAAEERRTGPAGISGRENAFAYITALCMIIQCRTVYMHLIDYGMIVNRGVWAVMMISLAACICHCSGNNQSGAQSAGLSAQSLAAESGRICMALAAYTAVFILVNPVNYLRVIRCSSALMLMIVLIRREGGKECCRRIMMCFRNLMTVIAAVSLFCWVFGTILKFLPCTGLLYMDWSATEIPVRIPTFLGIYFETQWTDWALVQARNSAVFTEAPMAGFCWSLALASEYYICPCRGRRRHTAVTVILTAAILSTLSVISYILVCAVLGSELIRRCASDSRMSPALKRAGLLLLAGITVLVGSFAWLKITQGSGNVRLNDFVIGFRAWLAHPFFGGGWENLDYLREFMPEWRRGYDTGYSNSPLEILAQGGIYIGSAYILAFIVPLFRAMKKRDMRTVVFIMLFAFLFTVIVVPYQYITFFVLVMLCGGAVSQDHTYPSYA